MKVSVIIPTKNRANFLKLCLVSLVKQSVQPDQVIIADNGSIDSTKKVAKLFKKFLPITYLYVSKSGVVHARNQAATVATGDIIAFTDDDCILSQQWIEQILNNQKYLDKYVLQGKAVNPNKTNLISEVMYFCSETAIRLNKSESQLIQNTVDGKPIFFDFTDTKNLIISKKVLEKIGAPFDTKLEKYNLGEDTELGIRLHSYGIQSVYCQDIVVYHQYITTTSQLIKKSFRLGKTEIAVMKLIKEKYPERYEQEKKYEKIFGKEIIKKISSKRYRSAKHLSQKYRHELLQKHGVLATIKFNFLLEFHIFIKKLGKYYQKLLYLL